MSFTRKPMIYKSTSSNSTPTGSTSRIPPPNPLRGSTSSKGGTTISSLSNARNGASSSNAAAGSSTAAPAAPAVGVLRMLDKDRKMVEYSSPADKCPVCFSDRYLNPSLRLMVSKCYHKMCESCIDRIFTIGPGPCPVCGQIIRKNQFKPQTYEDLSVEKEVAIRTRIAKIFNKNEEDFPDLNTYNDYLERVEIFTFNLINEVDVEETDRQIKAYQQENAEQIDVSASYAEREAELVRLRDEDEKKARQARAAEFLAQDAEDKREKAKDERELIQALEDSANTDAADGPLDEAEQAKKAKDIVKQHRAVALKRSSARVAASAVAPRSDLPDNSPSSLLSKYLRLNKSAVIEKDPFEPENPLVDYDTFYYDYRDLFSIENSYVDESTNGALQSDPRKLAGGFDAKSSVWERCLRSAVMGLWITPVPDESRNNGDVTMAV